MKNEFLPCKESLALRELGFIQQCCGYYSHKQLIINWNQEEPHTNHQFRLPHLVAAPLWQQAFRWFRETHHLDGHVTFPETEGPKVEGINSVYYNIEIYRLQGGDAHKNYKFVGYSDDYEKTQLACIQKLIKIVESEKITSKKK